MKAIELSVYGKDKLGKPMVDRKQYYSKPEADAVIARLEHQIEVLNADLTRCQESKAKFGDKILRLEAEVERYKAALEKIASYEDNTMRYKGRCPMGCNSPEIANAEKALSGGR